MEATEQLLKSNKVVLQVRSSSPKSILRTKQDGRQTGGIFSVKKTQKCVTFQLPAVNHLNPDTTEENNLLFSKSCNELTSRVFKRRLPSSTDVAKLAQRTPTNANVFEERAHRVALPPFLGVRQRAVDCVRHAYNAFKEQTPSPLQKTEQCHLAHPGKLTGMLLKCQTPPASSLKGVKPSISVRPISAGAFYSTKRSHKQGGRQYREALKVQSSLAMSRLHPKVTEDNSKQNKACEALKFPNPNELDSEKNCVALGTSDVNDGKHVSFASSRVEKHQDTSSRHMENSPIDFISPTTHASQQDRKVEDKVSIADKDVGSVSVDDKCGVNHLSSTEKALLSPLLISNDSEVQKATAVLSPLGDKCLNSEKVNESTRLFTEIDPCMNIYSKDNLLPFHTDLSFQKNGRGMPKMHAIILDTPTQPLNVPTAIEPASFSTAVTVEIEGLSSLCATNPQSQLSSQIESVQTERVSVCLQQVQHEELEQCSSIAENCSPENPPVDLLELALFGESDVEKQSPVAEKQSATMLSRTDNSVFCSDNKTISNLTIETPVTQITHKATSDINKCARSLSNSDCLMDTGDSVPFHEAYLQKTCSVPLPPRQLRPRQDLSKTKCGETLHQPINRSTADASTSTLGKRKRQGPNSSLQGRRCQISECRKPPVLGKGLCGAHYQEHIRQTNARKKPNRKAAFRVGDLVNVLWTRGDGGVYPGKIIERNPETKTYFIEYEDGWAEEDVCQDRIQKLNEQEASQGQGHNLDDSFGSCSDVEKGHYVFVKNDDPHTKFWIAKVKQVDVKTRKITGQRMETLTEQQGVQTSCADCTFKLCYNSDIINFDSVIFTFKKQLKPCGKLTWSIKLKLKEFKCY